MFLLHSHAVQNTFSLIGAPDRETLSALDQILALVRRSDSIAVKSEGTRVLGNVIRTLWSSDANSPDLVQKRQTAMQAVLTPTCAAVLAQLIGRSKRYPLLINEGVVALSLLSTHAQGGMLRIVYGPVSESYQFYFLRRHPCSRRDHESSSK